MAIYNINILKTLKMEKSEMTISLEIAVKNVSNAMSQFFTELTEDEVYTLIQCNKKIQKIINTKRELKLNL